MAEKAPIPIKEALPEIAENPEQLPPRDEAIDTVRSEIVRIQEELAQAEQKVDRPGATASANDINDNKENLRQLRENDEPRLKALREMWNELGGEEIEAAEQGVAELNFKSDAIERNAAQFRLRDAKNAFYSRLQESLVEEPESEEEVEPKKEMSLDDYMALALSGERPLTDEEKLDMQQKYAEAMKAKSEEEQKEIKGSIEAAQEELEDKKQYEADQKDLKAEEAEVEKSLEEVKEAVKKEDEAEFEKQQDKKQYEADQEELEAEKQREADQKELAEEAEKKQAEVEFEKEQDRKQYEADQKELEANREEVEESLDRVKEEAKREEEEREAGPEGPMSLSERIWYRLGALYLRGRAKIAEKLTVPDGEEEEGRMPNHRRIILGVAAIAGTLMAARIGFDLFDTTDVDASTLDQGGNHGGDANVDTGADQDKSGTGSDSEKGGEDEKTPGAEETEGTEETDTNNHEYPDEAYEIREGQGWLETMEKMGISDPDVQQSILSDENVMERLESMNLAYRAPELGGWGLYMTPDGTLPEEALDILQEAADAR